MAFEFDKKMSDISRACSSALFEEAKKYFPGGVNSPVRAFKSVYGSPLFIERGEGCFVWDADGNKFIDFCGSWGPLILGHSHPVVRKHVEETLVNGMSFGAPTRLENELARLILTNNRNIEKIRFVSSGTEAVMSALRLARGYTKRNKILKFEGCYHGHTDSMLVKAGSGLVTFGETSSAGVPKSFADETIVVPLDDRLAVEEAFRQFPEDIAAIIIEGIPANNGFLIQDTDYVKFLREITLKFGALLIFDEVITGFRLGFEGAAAHYGVKADIFTYGKIIGGGMPVGAYGASADIMANISPDGAVYQAGTLSGNPVAMAAGIGQLSVLLEPGFYQTLKEKTQRFLAPLVAHIKNRAYKISVFTEGSIFWIAFTDKQIKKASDIDPDSMKYFKELHRELLNSGIYFGPSGYEVGFVSAAHTDDILAQAAQVIIECIDKVMA